jgi:hypothetical protein
MLGQIDWGKTLVDLANIGATTAVTLKSKPWRTGVMPTPGASGPTPDYSAPSSTMKYVVGGVVVVGAAIVLFSMLKKKRS